MAQAMEKTKDATTQLYDLARAELERAGGNVTRAIAGMVEKLRENGPLLKELVAPLIIQAANRVTHSVQRTERKHMFPKVAPSLSGPERVAALANGVSEALLDFPLPGGKRLRDAVRADVVEASEFYDRQGSNMLAKSRWLRSIAQSVPDSKTVGQAITDERAADLWREACHDTV